MYVSVSSESVTAHDMSTLDKFDFLLAVDRDTADAVLRSENLGYLAADSAFAAVDWLVRQGRPNDEKWRRDFDAMLAYAADKGWYDGQYLQGHIRDRGARPTTTAD